MQRFRKLFSEKYHKVLLGILAALLLVADTHHSFKQHMQMQMDGDMTYNVLLSEGVQKMLNDPLALGVVFHGENYITPNRFVAHWSEHHYCWNMPLYLQKFTDPITSIYVSQALFKTLLQLALIISFVLLLQILLARPRTEIIFLALFVTPFFQTFGFNRQMGIIDQSTTYDFFYAYPFLFIIFYFYPVFRSLQTRKELSAAHLLYFIPVSFLIAFSGPLNPGIALVVCLVIGLHFCYVLAKNNWSLKSIVTGYWIKIAAALAMVAAMSLYSLYINHLNNLNSDPQPPLVERYILLLQGLKELFIMRIGLGWLFTYLLLNVLICKFALHADIRKSTMYLLKMLSIGCIIYLLLLPLGGYRSYRPFILRYDTFMPVTIVAILFFAFTTYQTLIHFRHKLRFVYYVLLVHMLIYFTQIDKIADPAFDCEKLMLQEIANSNESIVKLNEPCSVIGWELIYDYRKSKATGKLLQHWNVTKEMKYFYHDIQDTSVK